MLTNIKCGHISENVIIVLSSLAQKYSLKRFIGNPPKEVLYLDEGIPKYFFIVKCQAFLA